MNGTANIRRKLGSQRGASLPLALLLFLICGLVASVVLAAGTAAAGRSSQLSAADQRYYSVASAARLVQDKFDGQSATVSCVQVKESITQSTYAGSTVSRVTTGETVKSTVLYVDGTQVGATTGSGSMAVSTSGLSLPQISALSLILGANGGTVSTENLWAAMASGTSSGTKFTVGSYDLNHSVSGVPSWTDASTVQNALAVDITEWALASGELQFQFDSAHASSADDYYSLTLVCGSDFESSETTNEDRATPSDSPSQSDYVRTETVTTTTTRSTTVSWAATDLRKTTGE